MEKPIIGKRYDILDDGSWKYAGELIKVEEAIGYPYHKMYTFTKNNENTSYALMSNKLRPTRVAYEKVPSKSNVFLYGDIGDNNLGGFKKSRKSRKSRKSKSRKSKSRKSRKFRR